MLLSALLVEGLHADVWLAVKLGISTWSAWLILTVPLVWVFWRTIRAAFAWTVHNALLGPRRQPSGLIPTRGRFFRGLQRVDWPVAGQDRPPRLPALPGR